MTILYVNFGIKKAKHTPVDEKESVALGSCEEDGAVWNAQAWEWEALGGSYASPTNTHNTEGGISLCLGRKSSPAHLPQLSPSTWKGL